MKERAEICVERGSAARSWVRAALFCTVCLVRAHPGVAQSAPVDAIRERIESLRGSPTTLIAGEPVARADALVRAYELRRYAPLWNDPSARIDLGRMLDELPVDGLDATLYHAVALERLARADGPAAAADLDVLRTAALLEVIHDLSQGRARPALPGIGRDFQPAAQPDAAALLAAIESGRIRDAVARYRPRHFVYKGLQSALARLHRIAAAGGWETIPLGPALRRDSADARIPALRRRLAAEGYGAADSGSATLFDAPLERAVTSFQHRHGLNEDGIVGTRTRAELNVRVEARIDQVRVNLERARWLSPDLPVRLVVVNTAGAKVYLIDGQHVVFETRAIVGKQYTQTPLFSASMRTVDLDPTWTVPPGIVQEVLDDIAEDPGYLARVKMRVLDARARAVDPATVNFARFDGKSFPYTFRQDPGPANPLGLIKLLFPNRYNVYLHDTPSRGLFAREERAFSHGCIRVADPFGLAERVLDEPATWSRAALEAATGGKETRTLTLRRPIPVLVYYWTASTDEQGELHFYRDANRRDPSILSALGPTPGTASWRTARDVPEDDPERRGAPHRPREGTPYRDRPSAGDNVQL